MMAYTPALLAPHCITDPLVFLVTRTAADAVIAAHTPNGRASGTILVCTGAPLAGITITINANTEAPAQ